MSKPLPILWGASIVLAVATLPSLTGGSSAWAAAKPTKSSQTQERAARKACLNGDYAKGVAILSDLFLDTRDPTYIFNQGRCFEQNRRYDDAIARFEEYLRASADPQLDEADKAAAEKHIADCRERLGLPRVAETTPPPAQPAPVVAQPEPVAPPPPVNPVATVVAQPAAASPSSGKGLRVAGIITASVGAAALLGGVLVNAKVNSMASDMESTPGGYSSSKESDRKSYQTLGWVGYGVGAAAVATGAVLYVIGYTDGARASSVAVVPTVGAGQAGAMLHATF